MDGLRRILSATAVSLLGQGVTWTSTLLLTAACGRFLGDSEFGKLNLATSFVLLIAFPIELAFNQPLIRDVAQAPDRAPRYVTSILLLKGTIWVFLYGVILGLSWGLGYREDLRLLIAICGVSVLIGSVTSTFSACHFALARVSIPVAGGSLEKVLAAVVGIVILRRGASVVLIAELLLACSLINAAWQASWFLRRAGRHFVFDSSLIRELLSTSIPFLVYAGLGVIYYRIDAILLFQMTDAAVVGWYTAGYRLLDTLFFLPSIVINTIMYPTFAELSESDSERLKVAIEKCSNVLLFCSLPMATVMLVAAPAIVQLVYGRPEFVHAVPVLRGLAPGLVCLYVNSVLFAVIMSTRRERYATGMAAGALIFNLCLNLILIPTYRHVGAAIVTSLTELLLLGLGLLVVPRQLWPRESLWVGAKASLASLVMGATVWWLGAGNLVVLMLIAPFVYVVVAALLGTIPRRDARELYLAVRYRHAGLHVGVPEDDAPVRTVRS